MSNQVKIRLKVHIGQYKSNQVKIWLKVHIGLNRSNQVKIRLKVHIGQYRSNQFKIRLKVHIGQRRIPFPVLKINFGLLGFNENHFAKDLFYQRHGYRINNSIFCLENLKSFFENQYRTPCYE